MVESESHTDELLKENIPQVRLKIGPEDGEPIQSAGKLAPSLAACVPSDDVAPALSDDAPRHVAMSICRYYGLRFFEFVVDLTVVCMLSGAVYWTLRWVGIFSDSFFRVDYFLRTPFFWLGVISIFALLIKYVRGLFDYADIGLRVVDDRGRPLSKQQSFHRSIIFYSTWWLFLIHLIFMVGGSRRMIHDYLSDTRVIERNEDLETTFYPPASRWMAPLLVLAVVVTLCSTQRFVDQFAGLERAGIVAIFGRANSNLLNYLKMRLYLSSSNIQKVSAEEAKRLLPYYKLLNDEQSFQYDRDLEYDLRSVSVKMDAMHAVEYLFDEAILYAKAGMPLPAMNAIVLTHKYSRTAIDELLDAKAKDLQVYAESPEVMGAAFILRYGYVNEALAKARAVQADSLALNNRKGYLASTKMMIACLRILRSRAEAGERMVYDSQIRMQELDSSQLLRQWAQ